MALHKNFPKSPYQILDPAIRWFPADETLREQGYGKLLPPLVHKLREEVSEWRKNNYKGVSNTSYALLTWWFQVRHTTETEGETINFKYYFAQREAVETIVYCYEVAKIKNKYDLMRYDSSDAVPPGMFPEDWLRLVVKMATGSGKTKVMSLLIAWSYFHKLYETDSQLARNFLLITPNIIVLDRIKKDFAALKIFWEDPILPDDGFAGKNWKDDFQMQIHMQDNIGVMAKTGNIFLTNIHRVYNSKDKALSASDDNTTDYFLGEPAVSDTSDSKVNLGDIVRDVDELVVLNDEAHHIHDERLAWFKSIEDISNKMKMKNTFLSLQVDVTATPKRTNGSIFVQTIADYALVEAIHQDVVKHPVLPDAASREKLQEHKSSKFTEKYKEYIHLGFLEWKKAYERHEKMGKKAVFFIMTSDTRNCDEVADYLISNPAYPEFQSEKDVLVIHTNKNGEISENTKGKKEKELIELRKAANEIDSWDSSYKAIISVMMLKEGWDTRNVTTIVGLRPYVSESNILPEQTLGRGLRRMYRDANVTEYVSVVGTVAFMKFVESIKSEGVELESCEMGEGTPLKAPLVIEVDHKNVRKDIEKLDIEIPILSRRIYRRHEGVSDLDVSKFTHKKISVRKFSDEEQKHIHFRDISTGEITHTTVLDNNFVPYYQNIVGYFSQLIIKELRLVGHHDVVYEKVKNFVANHLFKQTVNLEDRNVMRNLSELEATKTVIETFKNEINKSTITDAGEAGICDYIKVSKTRPFVVKEQGCYAPKKSVFNKIIGDSHFELQIADFLDNCNEVISYVKNYFAVHLNIDYKDADGNIRDYYPDFIVKTLNDMIYVIETKGREDLDDPEKIKRLHQWCDDVNLAQRKVKCDSLYVRQQDFEKYTPRNFDELISAFGGKRKSVKY